MNKLTVAFTLLLMFSAQGFGESDRFCSLYGGKSTINDYVLEQCQDGDMLVDEGTLGARRAARYCKMGTIVTFSPLTAGTKVAVPLEPRTPSFICEYRKEHRTEIYRPTRKELKKIRELEEERKLTEDQKRLLNLPE